jgi:hypothetical protein
MANPGLPVSGFIFVGVEVTKLMILESKDSLRRPLQLFTLHIPRVAQTVAEKV